MFDLRKTLVLAIVAVLLLAAVPMTGAEPSDLNGDAVVQEDLDSDIWSWGRVDSGRLGNGETHERFTPLRVLGPGGDGPLADITAVSGGDKHTLSLRNDGTVWSWGSNDQGVLGVSGPSRSTPVQVRGPDGTEFLENITQVSAGSHPNAWDHNLALRADNTVWSWGYNAWGQLGDGTTDGGSVPRQVRGPGGDGFLENIVQVSAGAGHSLALEAEGTVWAWGLNSDGQLGDGTTERRSTPVQVLAPEGDGVLGNIVQVAAGEQYSLALSETGEVWAWGKNHAGQLGDGTTESRLEPVQVRGPDGEGFLENIDSVSAGSTHSLALQTHEAVWAWGAGERGQLGDGSGSSSTTPVAVAGPGGADVFPEVVAVHAGSSRSFGVTDDGSAWAWGSNFNGRLGDGTTTHRDTPVQIVGAGGEGFLTGAAQVPAGRGHSLVLDAEGHVWAWGLKAEGALGDGTTDRHRTPVHVLGAEGDGFLSGVRQLSAGSLHTLALRDDGSVWAWGSGDSGQLGQGDTEYSTIPLQVKGPDGQGFLEDVVQVAVGTFFSLALKDDGTVWAWGSASGTGQGGCFCSETTPVRVKGEEGEGFLEDIVAIGTGSSAGYGVGSDGTVWAWGSNHNGQLGDGTTDTRLVPARVVGPDGTGSLGDVEQVSSYGHTVLALMDDGSVSAWGRNDFGQVGDGTTDPRPLPVQVVGPEGDDLLTEVVQVAAGEEHSLALKEDGTVWVWGRGSSGRLGENSIDDRHEPVQVHGPDGVGFMEDAVRVSGGADHSILVRSDGTAWAWGNNLNSQLGEAVHSNQRRVPTQVSGPGGDGHLSGVRTVEAGGWHTLALTNLLRPTPPLDLNAVAGPGQGEIAIHWDPPADDGGSAVTDYRIYAGATSGNLFLLATVPATQSEYTETGLADGVTRHYTVTAVNEIGESESSTATNATTFDVPSAPSILSATAGPDPGQIRVTWDPPTSDGGTPVTQYHAVCGDESGGPYHTGILMDAPATVATVTALQDGTTYFCVVIAKNEVGDSAPSQELSATTFDTTTAPQNFTATPGTGEIGLDWDPPENDGGSPVTGYKVYGSDTSGDPYTLLGTVGSETTSINETGLGGGTTRCYVVSAENDVGEGPTSAEVCATTFDVPQAPQNLSASAGPGTGEISVSWDPPADDGGSPITGYRVYGGNETGGPYFLINGTDPGILSFEEEGLPGGSKRCYVTTAVNDIGESVQNNESCATAFELPGTPEAFTVTTGASRGTIDLTWDPPTDDGGLSIFAYRIYVGESPDGPFDLLSVDETTSFQHTGLQDHVELFYQVSAVNEAGEGETTAPVGSTTQPAEDPEPLPEGRSATAAAFQGHYAYVFGGRTGDNETTDSIVRFDPTSGNVTTLNTTLPTPRLGMSAIWAKNATGSGAGAQHCHGSCLEDNGFLFGGLELEFSLTGDFGPEHCHGSCRGGKQILEFDPELEVIEPKDAEFPDAVFGTSAVWDPVNEVAYIFGGFPGVDETEAQGIVPAHCHGSCRVGEKIWEYDPTHDVLEQQEEAMPAPMGGTSAVWDPVNNVAYIFGGLSDETDGTSVQHCHGSCRKLILRFDPNENVDQRTIEPLPVELPGDRWNTSAVFDGRYAYIMGGENETGPIDEIVRFDPVELTVEVVGSLPTERSQTSAIFDGKDAYVFGGLESDDNSTDDIARFTPRAPQQASAEAGPDPGQVTVSWGPPLNDGGEPVQSYRVYRSLGGQGTFLLVADLDVDLDLGPSSGNLSYIDTGLGNATTYEYRVSAVNLVGEGPHSREAPVRTFGVPGAPRDVVTSPGPGWGELGLEWEPPEEDGGSPVLGYRVYRADDPGGPYSLAATVPPELRAFTDTGLDDLDIRYYVIKAVNVVGEGDPSQEATGQTFDPMNLYVQPGGITLQQAADFVAAGGTIHLAPGEYPEEVVLATQATIQPGVADGPAPGALQQDGPAVIVGGVRVVDAPSLVLKEVQFNATKGGSLQGVALSTDGVSSVKIVNATFRGDGGSNGSGFFPGLVDLRGVEDLVFTGNTLEGDAAVPGSPSGLRVQYAGDGVSVLVAGNHVSGLKGAGVALTGSDPNATIEVAGNDLFASGDGVHVFNARFGALSMTRNTVEDHASVGIRFSGTVEGDPVLRYNAFTGNDVGVATSGGLGTVDARHNWWGHAGGPLAGDQANLLGVDYTPWCVESSCGLDEDLVEPVLP